MSKMCPLKVKTDNQGEYSCICEDCAWWVNDYQITGSLRDNGQCAIKQLATTINCEVKFHE